MKKYIISIVLISTLFIFGCNSDRQKLHIYTWAEYIDPEIIMQFETENNCQVVIDTFDSNESMLAKLLAGASGYDIVFPTSYIVPSMIKHNLLHQIDKNKIHTVFENFDKKYDKFIDDKDFTWSVPYAFGMTGIGWRSDKVNLLEEISWDVLSNNKIKRICLLDDIREMIGIALKKNGFSVNSVDENEHEAIIPTLIKWKNNSSKLDNVQYRTGLVSAEIYLAIGYNSDTLQVQDENPDFPIRFKIPKEGSTCCFDEIVVLKNADVDLSHKFINFIYRPEIAAKNCKYICSAQPNSGMLKFMNEDDLKNELMFPSEDILNRLELERDIGDGIELWNKTWDKFKSINEVDELRNH